MGSKNCSCFSQSNGHSGWWLSRSAFLVACLLLTATVFAQSSGGDFVLTKTTIDSGGGTASGVDYELTGTIAQPDANIQQSTGGDFILAGGFWASANDMLFSDGFESS